MKKLFYLFLLLIAQATIGHAQATILHVQPCSSFDCAMEQARVAFEKKDFRKAFNGFKAAKAFDPSKTANADAWIDKVFTAIEKQKIEAEENAKTTQAASKQAKSAQDKAEHAQAETQKSEKKLKIVIDSLNVLLSSVNRYKGREDSLIFYKISKTIADSCMKQGDCQCALENYKNAKKASQSNSFIEIPSEIIRNIEECTAWIQKDNEHKNLIIKTRQIDSLSKTGSLKNYHKALTILLTTNTDDLSKKALDTFYKKLIRRIEDSISQQSSIVKGTPKKIDKVLRRLHFKVSEKPSKVVDFVNKKDIKDDTYALIYLMLETYEYYPNTQREIRLFDSLSKINLVNDKIYKVYRDSGIDIKYPLLFDSLRRYQQKNIKTYPWTGFYVGAQVSYNHPLRVHENTTYKALNGYLSSSFYPSYSLTIGREFKTKKLLYRIEFSKDNYQLEQNTTYSTFYTDALNNVIYLHLLQATSIIQERTKFNYKQYFKLKDGFTLGAGVGLSFVTETYPNNVTYYIVGAPPKLSPFLSVNVLTTPTRLILKNTKLLNTELQLLGKYDFKGFGLYLEGNLKIDAFSIQLKKSDSFSELANFNNIFGGIATASIGLTFGKKF